MFQNGYKNCKPSFPCTFGPAFENIVLSPGVYAIKPCVSKNMFLALSPNLFIKNHEYYG